MRVEHVTVNEGGQAIVGNVFHGGRGPSEKKNQPHEAGICVSKSRPLLGHLKTDKGAVRGSRGTRLDRVPLPRSARRSAEGEANGSYKHGLHTKKREQSAAWFQIFSGDHGR
jgi:hypothetical protein